MALCSVIIIFPSASWPSPTLLHHDPPPLLPISSNNTDGIPVCIHTTTKRCIDTIVLYHWTTSTIELREWERKHLASFEAAEPTARGSVQRLENAGEERAVD